MKRTVLLCAVTLGLGLYLAPTVRTEDEKKAPESRLRFVNIAKVLRDFEKANQEGQAITEKRATYVKNVNAMRGELDALKREYEQETNPVNKKALEKKARELGAHLAVVDGEAQETLTKMSNKTVVQVYQEIKTIISEVGKEQQVTVFCYPSSSKPEDEDNPAVAQLMLQTPAAMPFHMEDGMDVTDLVLERLNKRFPAKAKVKE